MIQHLVREFHEATGSAIDVGLDNYALNLLRENLIWEELGELGNALFRVDNPDIVQVADALGDLAYVVYGAAVAFGINLDPIIREIHRSNMTKLGPDGKAITRADGKVLKGPDYEPPDLAPLLGVTSDA